MKLSLFGVLMVITAILCLVVGAALVLVPATVLGWYAFTTDAGALYMAQLFGVASLFIAALAWVVSNVPEAETQRNLAIAALLGNAIGCIVTLVNQLSVTPAFNALGWANAAVSFLLAVGFGYFLLTRLNVVRGQAPRPASGF